MAFVVDTKRNAETNKSSFCNNIKSCEWCKQKILKDEAIIIQYDISTPFFTNKNAHNIIVMHAKCLMNNIRKMQPDFWQKYMAELI